MKTLQDIYLKFYEGLLDIDQDITPMDALKEYINHALDSSRQNVAEVSKMFKYAIEGSKGTKKTKKIIGRGCWAFFLIDKYATGFQIFNFNTNEVHTWYDLSDLGAQAYGPLDDPGFLESIPDGDIVKYTNSLGIKDFYYITEQTYNNLVEVFQMCFENCGSCATPLSTLGAGNPMFPGTAGQDSVGSGDIPGGLTIPKKKKSKKKVQEGILDIDDNDFTMQDAQEEICKKIIDALDLTQHIKLGSEQDWKKFVDEIEKLAQMVNDKDYNKSAMATFRTKGIVLLTIKNITKDNQEIELRKFIQNPLPWSLTWKFNGTYAYCSYNQRTNHPTQINLAKWKTYVVPEMIWEPLWRKFGR